MRTYNPLWTIVMVLLAFWVAGLLFHVAGGLIHVLLVVAAVLFIFSLLSGRGRPVL